MNANTSPKTPYMNTPQAKVWLCWSPRQNCFYVEPEHEGLAKNRDAFLRDAKVDYVPIGIFPSEHDANATAHRLRPALREREQRAKVIG